MTKRTGHKQRDRKQGQQQQARFTSEYGSHVLETYGPHLFCTWGVPEAAAAAMRIAGRPVPADVAGALLLDTGAARTCIALQTATELGLQPTRIQQGYG